ncbi:MAG: YceD family protein [Nevskiales bacterium]|nr:YceD family protein [Nevskiales bacterium]
MPRSRADSIPLRASLSRALAGREHYAGPVPLAQLSRLSALLADTAGSLTADLQLEKDEQGRAWLRGAICGVLMLNCQRGLHPYAWSCEARLALCLVGSEAEEARVLRECEPYWVRDDVLPVRELIEDEVLLTLPMAPRCDDEDCVKRLS